MRIERDQRHEVYQKMLERFDELLVRKGFFSPYLCLILSDVTGVENPEDYPELIAKKPESVRKPSSVWFPMDDEGRAKRRQVLEECIEESK